ncbi:MAG: Gfo/Idh/MocA family oxidoreductase [Clostridia bacterium]|nr:Gfo/Idh/MocA family oxidoreductase [Clostridia bacterium]
MKKIKIAQIGTGHDHAIAAIQTLKLQSDIYDLVGYAVVSGDEDMYEAKKSLYDGLKKMTVDEILNYPGLDAVAVETEDRRLTEYAIKAAEKGLHIHMDKPGSESDEDFDRLIDLVKQKSLVFHTGYMYRYNPAVLKLKGDIKAGKLGEIYAVEAQMNCIHPVSKRQWLGNYPGGMLYFLGCHLIDLVYGILGSPEEVIPLSTSIGTDGVAADDFGMAVFKYKNGVSFVKSTAVEIGGFERRQLVVCGTKGTVELKPLEWPGDELPGVIAPLMTGVAEAFDNKINETSGWSVKGEHYLSPAYGRYDAMFRAFAAYVNGEKENPYTYEYEKELHKLILKACGTAL